MHGHRTVFPYLIGLLKISSLCNHHSFFNVPAKHDELLHVTFKVLPVYIKISLGTQVHVSCINGMCVCTKYINKVGSNALNMLSLPKEPREHTPYWCLSWNEIDNKHANASVREHGCIPQPWCSSRKKWKEKKQNKTHRWVPAKCEYSMTLRCYSRPWLCSALACHSVRGREDSQDCQESQVKRVNLERVSLARRWVWGSIDWPVSSIYYLVQPVMRIWIQVIKTWWTALNIRLVFGKRPSQGRVGCLLHIGSAQLEVHRFDCEWVCFHFWNKGLLETENQ